MENFRKKKKFLQLREVLKPLTHMEHKIVGCEAVKSCVIHLADLEEPIIPFM